MTRLWIGCLVCVTVWAQDGEPVGVVRASFLGWEGAPGQGELILQNPRNHVYRCSFDSKTYFERDKKKIEVKELERKDHLEVVADRGVPPAKCYARMVYVLDPEAQRRPSARTPRVPYRGLTENIVPRGNLTFSGIVVSLTSERLVLRTRSDARREIALRHDTRFLSSGLPVDHTHLKPNTRVYVRAGRNLENQVEAYQVVWGEILQVQ